MENLEMQSPHRNFTNRSESNTEDLPTKRVCTFHTVRKKGKVGKVREEETNARSTFLPLCESSHNPHVFYTKRKTTRLNSCTIIDWVLEFLLLLLP